MDIIHNQITTETSDGSTTTTLDLVHTVWVCYCRSDKLPNNLGDGYLFYVIIVQPDGYKLYVHTVAYKMVIPYKKLTQLQH